MEQEILNIDYHVKKMLIGRLNNPKYRTLDDVAESLGITPKTLHNYKRRYNILWSRATQSWIEVEKITT